MDCADDLADVDALEVDAGVPRVGVLPELTLDHDERNALVGHFDRMSVPQPVRRERPPHTCLSGSIELLACGRRLPAASSGRW